MTIRFDIVVTQHTPLAAFLIERGIITADTPVITHAGAEHVRGKHVIGILPHWLSSIAASFTEIPLRTTPADREAMTRGDIGVERLRQIAGEPVTYTVEQIRGGGIDRARPRWLAAARAYEHVERVGYHFGAGPGVYPTLASEWRGLPVTLIGDDSQQASAQLIESRGVWRPNCRGPWLDGYGREIADDDIAPAAGWAGFELVEHIGETETIVGRFDSQSDAIEAAGRCTSKPGEPDRSVSVRPFGRVGE